MFNVYDPKTIRRGSVPVQEMPLEDEIALLQGLADPFDKNVDEGMRKAAVERLAAMGSGLVVDHWDFYVVQLSDRFWKTRHLVGRVGFSQNVLVTSAVDSIDSKKRLVVTETGATFLVGAHVQGSPLCDSVWADWVSKQKATVLECITEDVKDAVTWNDGEGNAKTN